MEGIFRKLKYVFVLILLLVVWINQNKESKVVAANIEYSLDTLPVSSLCFSRPVIPPQESHWLYVPQSASELYTEVNYSYLAGKLIQGGHIDAGSCPGGGLGIFGYANACGLAAAKPAVIHLQNLYDNVILDAFKETGTPPVLLKQLIRYESQFWPEKLDVHFGFGHLTYFGAYTALRWSPYLFQTACRATYTDGCSVQTVDDLMAGSFLSLMAPQCPNCEYSIDDGRAKQSVTYLSYVLQAYCQQTSTVITNATKSEPGLVVDYPMIWKLTLFNYNVGPSCLYNAIGDAFYRTGQTRVDWEVFSSEVSGEYCERGLDYVENITAPFYDFPP